MTNRIPEQLTCPIFPFLNQHVEPVEVIPGSEPIEAVERHNRRPWNCRDRLSIVAIGRFMRQAVRFAVIRYQHHINIWPEPTQRRHAATEPGD